MSARFSPRRTVLAVASLCGVAAGLWWLQQSAQLKQAEAWALGLSQGLPEAQREPRAPEVAQGPRAPSALPRVEEALKAGTLQLEAVPARLLTACGFLAETEPAMAAFADWVERFLQADAAQRQGLLAEGVALAKKRREVLAQWIQNDPRRALAAAVPLGLRQVLPAEVLALLETRFAGQGELTLLGATAAEGSSLAAADTTYRKALVAGQEYRAYTFGRRAQSTTLPVASLNGIALDGQAAVNDSPIRVLEAGEEAGDRAVLSVCSVSGIESEVAATGPLNGGAEPPRALEANGRVEIVCSPEHVAQREVTLAHLEGSGSEVLAGNNLPGSSGVVGRPAQSWTHGTKKLLIIRVDFSDKTGTPLNRSDSNATITDAYAVNLINGSNGVRDYYVQGSYGKTTLSIAEPVSGDSPDVTPVLRMPQTAAYYATNDLSGQLHTDARTAAAAAGVAVDSYDRVGVVFTELSSIAGSKITYGGLGSIDGRNFWINGSFSFGVVTHEIGHNYGLQHSNFWQVSDGNPVSPTGTSVEYGDIFDIMGSGSSAQYHFSHWNKSILQWIPDTAVPTISSSGTYRVYRFDHADANLANNLALKVVRNRTQDYWIGLRRGTSNASLNGGAYVLWGYNDNRQGNLLDLSAPVNTASSAALAVGQSFTDTVAGVTLQTVAQGGSGADEWLDIQVTLQPRISWAQDEFIVDEQGGTATLTLNRENNASGTVSVNYATSAGTATSGTDYTLTSGSVTWADGDMTPKTVTIPIVADALVEGSESFTVTLSGLTGSAVIVNSTSTTVTIADPGARDAAFAPEFVNSSVEDVLLLQDGSAVIGGWFGTLQDADYNLYTRGGVTRILPTGKLDPTFAVEGGFGAFDGSKHVSCMARQVDGKILVCGSFTSFSGRSCGNILRLNADGTVDTSFNSTTGANDDVNTLLLQPDGKIIIGGYFTAYNGTAINMLARLNTDGSVDTGFTPPTFGGSGASGWRVSSLALQPDGKILVGGSYYFNGGQFKAGLCRVLATGVLDTTFNGVTSGAHALGDTSYLLTVSDIAVEMDGRILIAGNFTAYNGTARGGFARLTNTGALDASLTSTTDSGCNTVLVQPDGRILVGGDFTTFNGSSAKRLVRLSSSGVVESGFVAAGGADEPTGASINAIRLQPDGKLLLGGTVTSYQGSANSRPYWRIFGGLPGLPGMVQLGSEVVAGVEGSSAVLSLTRTGGSSGTLSVGYSTVAGTAGSADYTTTRGTVTWAHGDATAKSITIPITADALAESAESFAVQLGEPLQNAAILGSVQRATVNVSTAFDAWRSRYFTPLELADSAVSGDTADPDGDGLANLLEFSLDTSPLTAVGASTALPSCSVQNVSGTSYLTLTFKRRTPALDLTYNVQTNSGTLSSADWSSNAVLVGSPVANGDGTETVTFRDPTASTSSSRRFMRVQVVRTP